MFDYRKGCDTVMKVLVTTSEGRTTTFVIYGLTKRQGHVIQETLKTCLHTLGYCVLYTDIPDVYEIAEIGEGG